MEYAGSPFEIKQLDDAGHIEGFAAAFGNVDHGGDKMLFGSFTKSLGRRGDRPLPMLLHHDHKRPVGVWSEWKERPEGLFVKGRIVTDTRDGAEAHSLARSGALGGISIGYVAQKKSFEAGARVLAEVDLHEASLVTIPMNDLARVSAVKSITRAQDIREMLQAAGVTSARANEAAGLAWKAINQSTDETQADAELAALIQAATARLAKGGRKSWK